MANVPGNRRIKDPAVEIDGRPVPDWMQLLSLRQITDYLGVGKSIVLSPGGPPAIRLGRVPGRREREPPRTNVV